MHQENRLPRNSKEGVIYGTIIVTLSVLIIGSINMILAAGGFNQNVAMKMLINLPLIWIIVMIIEPLAIGRFAEFLSSKFISPTDGFAARIMFRTLFTVLGMSFTMTIIGEIIGNGFTPDIFDHFTHIWPRNFLMALFLESLVIQPIARLVMVKMHEAQDRKVAF
ncbi:hypothetical protein BK720_02255 [Bacillus thuringiensis serovar brasilensis]|uniref:DUF2798 domain-containing protein n=1 Tax=Bacillus cereus group TaxID=86661 RepID=UPI000A3D40EF|nr:DUF2798 domain-containing protein [Bacillus thuringiensis]MCU5031400.1 DUF2798 domain-containing protein [Bacillus cereus]MRA74139.1 DUF2798 domain-containing protein [Bacillus thuringiensis]MRA92751.1 DUF2798 domain-containing protein [Bacillus thuringiensis]MRC55303.1 DUF2798 domain-containing protein [Bacillus thuringiensis]OTX38753.1 hypothetical protein BK720_02255 [Bacillus thuringiensis serovar brasilensis]